MNDNTMVVPKDFGMGTIEKAWFDKDVVVVIYFDENKWYPKEIGKWADTIREFTDCPVMMLPKSFSSPKCFTYEQMLQLKNIVDDIMDEMNRGKNN